MCNSTEKSSDVMETDDENTEELDVFPQVDLNQGRPVDHHHGQVRADRHHHPDQACYVSASNDQTLGRDQSFEPALFHQQPDGDFPRSSQLAAADSDAVLRLQGQGRHSHHACRDQHGVDRNNRRHAGLYHDGQFQRMEEDTMASFLDRSCSDAEFHVAGSGSDSETRHGYRTQVAPELPLKGKRSRASEEFSQGADNYSTTYHQEPMKNLFALTNPVITMPYERRITNGRFDVPQSERPDRSLEADLCAWRQTQEAERERVRALGTEATPPVRPPKHPSLKKPFLSPQTHHRNIGHVQPSFSFNQHDYSQQSHGHHHHPHHHHHQQQHHQTISRGAHSQDHHGHSRHPVALHHHHHRHYRHQQTLPSPPHPSRQVPTETSVNENRNARANISLEADFQDLSLYNINQEGNLMLGSNAHSTEIEARRGCVIPNQLIKNSNRRHLCSCSRSVRSSEVTKAQELSRERRCDDPELTRTSTNTTIINITSNLLKHRGGCQCGEDGGLAWLSSQGPCLLPEFGSTLLSAVSPLTGSLMSSRPARNGISLQHQPPSVSNTEFVCSCNMCGGRSGRQTFRRSADLSLLGLETAQDDIWRSMRSEGEQRCQSTIDEEDFRRGDKWTSQEPLSPSMCLPLSNLSLESQPASGGLHHLPFEKAIACHSHAQGTATAINGKSHSKEDDIVHSSEDDLADHPPPVVPLKGPTASNGWCLPLNGNQHSMSDCQKSTASENYSKCPSVQNAGALRGSLGYVAEKTVGKFFARKISLPTNSNPPGRETDQPAAPNGQSNTDEKIALPVKQKKALRASHDQEKEKTGKVEALQNCDKVEKREDLVYAILKRLDYWRIRKASLEVEEKENELVGEDLEKKLVSLARTSERKRFHNYMEDIDRITKLMLILTGSLARVENSMMQNPAQYTTLTRKKAKLIEQLQEAQQLQEGVESRSGCMWNMVSRYLERQDVERFRIYLKNKTRLIVELRETQERIRCGEEQMNIITQAKR